MIKMFIMLDKYALLENCIAADGGSHFFGAHCRLWTPIDGEFDDYIVNPKASGYQVRLLPDLNMR